MRPKSNLLPTAGSRSRSRGSQNNVWLSEHPIGRIINPHSDDDSRRNYFCNNLFHSTGMVNILPNSTYSVAIPVGIICTYLFHTPGGRVSLQICSPFLNKFIRKWLALLSHESICTLFDYELANSAGGVLGRHEPNLKSAIIIYSTMANQIITCYRFQKQDSSKTRIRDFVESLLASLPTCYTQLMYLRTSSSGKRGQKHPRRSPRSTPDGMIGPRGANHDGIGTFETTPQKAQSLSKSTYCSLVFEIGLHFSKTLNNVCSSRLRKICHSSIYHANFLSSNRWFPSVPFRTALLA